MSQNKPNMLGPGLRNICDILITDLNNVLFKIEESKKDPNLKRTDFRSLIKTKFYPNIIKIRKIMKNTERIHIDSQTIMTLNQFYNKFAAIQNELDFINKLSELYTFPIFNLEDSIDLIFNGCTNNLRKELVKENLFNLIPSKNLYDNNDISFLINNDLNIEDYNKEDNNIPDNYKILTNKENNITASIIERLNKKFDEFNNYIALNIEDFEENDFKIYLDDNICIKLYDNFLIKFILVQQKLNINKYFILPIEISYNNEKINLNDKEDIFVDKNNCLLRKDLQYFIDKFKPKIINFQNAKNKEETNVEIERLTKDDFLEKCLLFKKYTKKLFNEKFENLKQKILNYIEKYDIPINIPDKMNMDIDNKEESNTNDINELIIYYNFALKLKEKDEFYIKLIYNKNYPTVIKMVFFQSKSINQNHNNIQEQIHIRPIYIQQIEKLILFNLKEIKKQIQICYNDYKEILINLIFKKLKYLYPMFFDFGFQLNDKSIIFGLKSSKNQNIISKKFFSIYINDLGKLSYNNLFSSKLFCDNFKEINSIIMNFLKNRDNEKERNVYLYKFNYYINQIILEKIFSFQGTITKLIELNNERKLLVLHLYNSYYTDKNISTYFEIKCEINKGKVNNNINNFNISETKLICLNNKNQNQKLILNCFEKYLTITIDFNGCYNIIFNKIINNLNNKYELFMFYASDIIKLSEKQNSVFEINKTIEITNLINHENKEDNWYELSTEKNNMQLFQENYRKILLKYFYKIRFSKENNVFHFYLRPEIFKKKYLSISKIENYSIIFQYYIIGYDYKDDFISIIVLSKLKIGYINIIQLIFETCIQRIISYMDSIFNLLEYLSKNNISTGISVCPLLLTLQIKYSDSLRNINFHKYINFKISEKEPYFIAEGSFNNIFNGFVKEFGNELIKGEYDYINTEFYLNKSKYFYLVYSIYDLFLNEFKFKYSLLLYPYNHFRQNTNNIYFLNKEFGVLELIAYNNGSLLLVQITPDNNLLIEFKENSKIDINGNINNNRKNNLLNIFNGEIGKLNFNYNIIEQNEKIVNFIIDDKDSHEKISLIEKLRIIVNIFVNLSKN